MSNTEFDWVRSVEIPVEGIQTAPQLLLGSKSYLVDRIQPSHEYITLPPIVKPGGIIKVNISDDLHKIIPTNLGRKEQFKQRITLWNNKFETRTDGIYFDFRMMSPQNWSHALNLHIPYAHIINHSFAKGGMEEEITFLLPKNISGNVLELFRIFKVKTFVTDSIMSAYEARTAYEDWGLIQVGRHRWVKDLILPAGILNQLDNPAISFPENIFLSRKDTRTLRNERELIQIANQFGYHLIYPEEYSPSDQINLFLNAERIIAIHGAGMGPLLYCHGRLKSVVEMFTPGHMSAHFRTMCSLIGIPWVGIRGRIDKAHANQAYRFDRPYRKYSQTDFEVCCDTLRFALNDLDKLCSFEPNFLNYSG